MEANATSGARRAAKPNDARTVASSSARGRAADAGGVSPVASDAADNATPRRSRLPRNLACAPVRAGRRRFPEGNRAALRPARRSIPPGSKVQPAPGTAAANGRSLRGVPDRDRIGRTHPRSSFCFSVAHCRSCPLRRASFSLARIATRRATPCSQLARDSAFCTEAARRAMTRNVA